MLTLNRNYNFIKMPLPSWSWTATTDTDGELLTKLLAPRGRALHGSLQFPDPAAAFGHPGS